MDVIGLIAEYNPFHNGHIYQIKKVKELYKDSLLIVILNNYFTERGEISCLTKEDKIKTCLDYDIDLVIELPILYGSQAADIFAYQAIKILNKLNINKLVFGSESNDLDTLKKIALLQEDKNIQDKLKEELDKGNSYPESLKNALNIEFNYLPNDLLGISYIKAINKINPLIEAISIKRTNSYHDLENNSDIVSAENIRNRFNLNEDIKKYTPIYNKIKKIDDELYFNILKNKILTDNHLDEYLDVNEGIENRLKKEIVYSNNIEDYLSKLKTKRYSYNKLKRMLLHIFLGIKKEDNKEYDHLKILGMSELGQKYLKDNKIKVKQDDYLKNLELKSALLYDLLTKTNTYEFELKNIPVKK